KNKITVHMGTGTLTGATSLTVKSDKGEEQLSAKHIIVATGALEELEAESATRGAMAVEAVTDAAGVLEGDAVDGLVALAAYITDRRH
ncbi:MAG: hypothetical protein ACO35E_12070, partial [Ilumatobacteraceae bacterium]